MACKNRLQILSQAWSQGRLATVSCIVGGLASIANTPTPPITVVLLASSRVIDVWILGIDLDSLVICTSALAPTRESGLGKLQAI